MSDWRSATCSRCGAAFGLRAGACGGLAGSLRYDRELDAIVCKRGVGCARQRDEDIRIGRAEVSAGYVRSVPQFRHEGVWWTIAEIVEACAGVSRSTVEMRLRKRWLVGDVISRTADRPATARISEKFREAALERAGVVVQIKQKKAKQKMAKRTPIAAVQKNIRFTQDHERALARATAALKAQPRRIPEWLGPHLTPGREICESDVAGALASYLEQQLSNAEAREATGSTDRE